MILNLIIIMLVFFRQRSRSIFTLKLNWPSHRVLCRANMTQNFHFRNDNPYTNLCEQIFHLCQHMSFFCVFSNIYSNYHTGYLKQGMNTNSACNLCRIDNEEGMAYNSRRLKTYNAPHTSNSSIIIMVYKITE